MKYNPTVHFISPRECPYTANGQNIAELRRAKLRKIAESIKVDSTGSKNEILGRVITRLRSLNSDKELANS